MGSLAPTVALRGFAQPPGSPRLDLESWKQLDDDDARQVTMQRELPCPTAHSVSLMRRAHGQHPAGRPGERSHFGRFRLAQG
jgi:hypothetical protein